MPCSINIALSWSAPNLCKIQHRNIGKRTAINEIVGEPVVVRSQAAMVADSENLRPASFSRHRILVLDGVGAVLAHEQLAHLHTENEGERLQVAERS